MEPAIFLIAILGCGEGDSPCQQVRTLDSRYESQAACSAAMEAALSRNVDIDFPVVAAECVVAGAKTNPPKSDQVQRPGPGRADLRISPVRS